MSGSNNKFLYFFKSNLRKMKPRFSFHYIAYTTLFFAVIFSFIHLVSATTPNPGHPWSELGDGVFVFTNSQTSTPYTYTFPAANTTVLTTNAAVTVAQGGTNLTSIASGSILAANSANTLSAVTSTSGTKVLTNTSGTITWETASSGMVYPGSGIANSTGSSWGTSYSTTGSGTVVALATTPTFITSIITPKVIGGTGTTTDLYFQTTSGVGATGADMHFLVGNNGGTEAITILNNGNVGIGSTNPSKLLTVTGDALINGLIVGRGGGNIGSNTVLGNALSTNTTGLNNVAVGDSALISNTTGGNNVAIGAGSLWTSDSSYNTAIGANSLASLYDGTGNVAIGFDVISGASSDSNNVAIGNSIATFGLGNNNVVLGKEAMTNAGGSNNNNTIIGYQSGYSGAAGTDNIFLGNKSGYYETGSNTLIIDNQSRTNESDARNKALIYGLFNATASSQILSLGGGGNVGISVISPSARLQLPAGTATAGTAPLKLTSGTNLTTPENGAIEYNGTHLYFTTGGTRYQLDQQSGGSMVYPGAGIANSTGSAWGTSYSTTGSGTVVALQTSPVFTTPSLGVATATSINNLPLSQNNTDFNVLIGKDAGLNIVSGAQYNTFVGYEAGKSGGSGGTNAADANNAFGYQSLFSNTTGQHNLAMGNYSLYSNTSGTQNIAIGHMSSEFNTTGTSNVAIGTGALTFNKVSSGNVAIGASAMANANDTTTPFIGANTAVGNGALMGSLTAANNTGVSNTALGYQSLYSMTSGNYNVGLGDTTLYSNNTGSHNLAMGHSSMLSNTSGQQNTAIGSSSLYANTDGYNNIAIGFDSAHYQSDGSTPLTSANSSIYIGHSTKGYNNSDSNSIVIGYNTTGNGSNTVTIGNSSILRTYLRGVNIAAGTATAGTAPLKLTSGTNLTTPENGAIEYNGTHLYFTTGGTRYQLDQQSGGSMVYPGAGIANSTGSAWGTSYSTTGSGTVVALATSPTFSTSIFTPYVIGGTGTTSDLFLQTTSGVGATGADMHFLVGNNGGTEAMTILNDGMVKILAGASGDPIINLSNSGGDWFLYQNNVAKSFGIKSSIGGSDVLTISGSSLIGNVGIGVSSPSATLHLKAGTAAGNTAPLKLTSGTNLTTPENGAIEYNGTHLYFTTGGTRYQLDQQSASVSIGSTITGATQGSILFAGASGVLAQNNAALSWDDSTYNLYVQGTITVGKANMLRLNDSDDSNYVAFRSPTTVTSNIRWTLPDTDASGCFKSDGAGTMSIGACGDTNEQVFASNGNYTKPTNALMTIIELWGGGGGGGGGYSGAVGTVRSGGAGGGGGAYTQSIVSASHLSSSIPVTVGSSGTAGTTTLGTSMDGGAGGRSCLSSSSSCGGTIYASAYGGGGGNGGNGTAGSGGGGGGGALAVGTTNATQATGGTGGNPLGASAGAANSGAGGAGGATAATSAAAGGAGYFGGAGGGASTTAGGANSGAGGGSYKGGSGGGAGGTIATAYTLRQGGAGGASSAASAGGGTAGTTEGAAGGAGAAGVLNGGAGGGGGATGSAVVGGAGGAGGQRGGGGGGGGASNTTSVGAAGGAGGTGYVRIFTLRGAGADLAEVYGSFDDTLIAGEVVALDQDMKAGVKRTSKAYDNGAIGVISTDPGLIIGNIEDSGAEPVLVALSGRVPVKVNMENGPIHKGDYITASSEPGVAMRATKAGTIIGQAMTEYIDEDNPGYIVVFIKSGPSNGVALKQILPGLSLDSVPSDAGDVENIDASNNEEGDQTNDNTQITEEETIQKMALQYFLANKMELSQATEISEIYTDRLSAALEIITPTVITDTISTNQVIASTGEVISFNSPVEFVVPPLFNNDTAGFALIKEGDRRVRVTYKEPYIGEPVVSADLSFNVLDGITDIFAKNIFDDDLKYMIVDSDQEGFTILINKEAPRDLRFSWTALSVKDPQVFESVIEGLIFEEETTTNDTSTDEDVITEGENNSVDTTIDKKDEDTEVVPGDSVDSGSSGEGMLDTIGGGETSQQTEQVNTPPDDSEAVTAEMSATNDITIEEVIN